MHLIDIVKIDQKLLNDYLRAAFLQTRYQVLLNEIKEFNDEKFFDLIPAIHENYISARLNAFYHSEIIRNNYLKPLGYEKHTFFPDSANSSVLIYGNENGVYTC